MVEKQETNTFSKLANHVIFNSVTDNPYYGDERKFFKIRKLGEPFYSTNIHLIPGEEYEAEIFFHNNANPILNKKENNYMGIALDVKLNVWLPATIKKGQTLLAKATISATHPKPQVVFSEVYLSSLERTVALRYKMGSGIFINNSKISGQLVSGTILDEGIKLGYENLNGILPGGPDYAGKVRFQFKVDYPDFKVESLVAEDNSNDFFPEITSISDTFRIDGIYRNTGSVIQNNVNIKVILPDEFELVPGTTRITSSQNEIVDLESENWFHLSDNICSSGINIGNYSSGYCARVSFIIRKRDLMICGSYSLIVQYITANGGKSDRVNLNIVKKSKPIAYIGEEPFIFFSYSRTNNTLALEIIENLQKNGYRVWYDEGILPSSDWADQIALKIEKCSGFLALISEEYLKSKNCMVELAYSKDYSNTPLLVYLDNVSLPRGHKLYFSGVQALNFFEHRDIDLLLRKVNSSPKLYNCK